MTKEEKTTDSTSNYEFIPGRYKYRPLKSDDKMRNSFISTGAFLEGTHFWRSSRTSSQGSKAYWHYTCPACSQDEYVVSGLCTGVFETKGVHLQQGHLACRCSHNYRWSQQQREYQIRSLIIKEDLQYEYRGVLGTYKGSSTKVKMMCKKHGEFTPSINDFINGGRRCPSCAQTGYDRSKIGYLYILQVEGVNGEFTGYGITGNPSQRLQRHRSRLSALGFQITRSRVFIGGGQEILDTENFIKDNYTLLPQTVKGFITEATEFRFYNDICNFALNKFEEIPYEH